MLRNRRGATSLRWLRALLDHGVEVHGQIVVCPGRNDGDVLDDTLVGVLDRYPELASLCVVPLGVSRFNPEPRHAAAHAGGGGGGGRRRRGLAGRLPARCSATGWCSPPTSTTCWPAVRSPSADAYEGFPMHEDGIGMARTFELEFSGQTDELDRACGRASSPGPTARRPVSRYEAAGEYDAPADGYRAVRTERRARATARPVPVSLDGPTRQRAGRRPHRRLRRAGPRPARGVARA